VMKAVSLALSRVECQSVRNGLAVRNIPTVHSEVVCAVHTLM